MFNIDFDEARSLVRVTGTGTWDPVALAKFALEIRRIEIHHLVGRRNVRILGDARSMTVQPEPVVQLCRVIAMRLLRKPGLRFAVIAGSTLARMQLDRFAADLPIGVFMTEADALAHLDLEAPEVRAAA